jgi:inosine/xanthosine triphosphatase
VKLAGTLSVVVASTNPVKIRAALAGFRLMFPGPTVRAEGIEVASIVSPQPRSDSEALRGAEARAARAREAAPDADAWVGIEGGVAETEAGMVAYAWVVVRSPDRVGRARTGTFFLPEAVARLVREGMELGLADDRVFGSTDSKRKTGAVGLLTGGAIDREALYQHAVALALIPFCSPDLYPCDAPRESAP